MVITLTVGDSKMYIPVNPAQIKYAAATFYQEYTILNKGPAKVPSGSEISTISWESFFPGSQLMDMPFVNSETTASDLHKQIESWRKKGQKIKLNITETPFSFDVYIDKYEVTCQDAYGSLYYTIEFSKAITVSVETVKKKRSSKKSSKKKYKVKKGDCLWKISKKFYKKGNKWKKIYKANKSTIEKAAKKHGKKSSSNGKWIYPGTVLKIP